MQFILRLFKNFRHLQWKLTFAYSMMTFLVSLALLGSFIIYLVYFVNTPSAVMRSILQTEAQHFGFYFHHGTPDRVRLVRGLQELNDEISGGDQPITYHGFIAVVGRNGSVITAIGDELLPPGASLQAHLPADTRSDLHAMLIGKGASGATIRQETGDMLVVTQPIVGEDQTVAAGIIWKALHPQVYLGERVPSPFVIMLQAAPALLLFAVLLGLIFGIVTTRGFVGRFKKFAQAVTHWSQGDFSIFVKDASGDEIGLLARQLNQMAEQLQNLLQMRQKLASLEERARLARDLHDSVKQQVFAVSMQLRTARTLLKRDVEKARECLLQAEQLTRQTQQELTALLRQLRPIVLEEKGLILALREYLMDWARQTGISATMSVEGEPALSLKVEEAFYRIAQEALSNVARHSQATAVQMKLCYKSGIVVLSICDNGQGFDQGEKLGRGMGLLSMRERLEVLGGHIEIESERGKGTTIVASCEQRYEEQ